MFAAGVAAALVAGWWAFPRLLYERVPQPIQFDHALHTGEEVALECTDCHGFDDEGRFTGIPSAESCAGCHGEMLGNSDEERRLVEDYLEPEREIEWLAYARQPDNADFPHAQHVVLAELACTRCHGDHATTTSLRPLERNRISGYSRDVWGSSISGLVDGDQPGMKMSTCCDCHRQSGVTQSCLDCHK
jgi:hypothetical protein